MLQINNPKFGRFIFKNQLEKLPTQTEKVDKPTENSPINDVLNGINFLKSFYSKPKNRDKEFVKELIGVESHIKRSSPRPEEIRNFISPIIPKIKETILKLSDGPEKDAVKKLAFMISENSVMRGFYENYGNSYSDTNCVEFLKQNNNLMGLMEESPVRFLSDGADLVYHENFGKVVDKVEREDFQRLNKYKPIKDKVYIFGLVKEPLMYAGKPNITHIQIPTDLSNKSDVLTTIHASSDRKQVVTENDFQSYLEDKDKGFERVYVFEIDLKNPNYENPVNRLLMVNDGQKQRRPQLTDMPLLPREKFEVRNADVKDAEISEEEIKTLDILSDNQDLKLITLMTAIREGKLGDWNNYEEALGYNIIINPAYGPIVNPAKHSVGLHQIAKKSGVTKLFNNWIDSITESKANEFGEPIISMWRNKQKGKEIGWEELSVKLSRFDFKNGKYKDVKTSTICAYLLLEHLVEDQLKSAYKVYKETYRGLEDQPENIIAVAGAYRNNMDILITGSQQYRVAEIALEMGLIDKNFNFTEAVKTDPVYSQFISEVDKKHSGIKKSDVLAREKLPNEFLIDGFKGAQMAYLTYMIYKRESPNDTRYTIENFKKAFATSRTAMLSSEASKLMQEIYEKKFGTRPKLLMTEEEHRENEKFNTEKIKFANEGLWAESHFERYARENWQEISKRTGSTGYNSLMSNYLKERSIKYGEVSKLSPEKVRSFNVIIAKIPDGEYYKKYPESLLTIAMNSKLGYFQGNAAEKEQKFLNHLDTLFGTEMPELEKRIGKLSEQAKMQIAPFLDLCGVETTASVIKEGILSDPARPGVNPDKFSDVLGRFSIKKIYKRTARGLSDLIDNNNFLRTVIYPKSFKALEKRFEIASIDKLRNKKPETLSDKERKELFVLDTFEKANSICCGKESSRNYAYVITAIASLETGWGKDKNEWGDPTLFKAANNLFSVKANYNQFTEDEFISQSSLKLPYYIHHTKEYVSEDKIFSRYSDSNKTLKEFEFSGKRYNVTKNGDKYFLTWRDGKTIEFKQGENQNYFECYEAFKKYPSISDSISDLVDLLKREYPLAMDVDKTGKLSTETMENIFSMLVKGEDKRKYATDPQYAEKGTVVAKSILEIMKRYGLEV